MPVEQHAYLSASSAHRWLICPPIIQLESEFEDRGSSFAEEGTQAHALAELKLQEFLGQKVKTKITKFKKEASYYDGEMDEATDYYRDLVVERFNQYEEASMELEVRVDFSKWVPEGFGTSDVVILADDVIEIIDLKYGKGVPVDAYQNPQLMLYALGAYATYDVVYDFNKIRMTVVQPRLDSLSTFEVEVEELLYWANNYVAPRAIQAYEGIGEWNITEDVMKFSKVRAQLRPRAEANFEIIEEYDFKESALLEPDEIAAILSRASEIKSWLDHVESYALDQAVNHGVTYPGFKVVEGRSNRKISDEVGLSKVLVAEGFEEDKIFKPRSLQNLTALEKVVGKNKFSEIAEDFIVKPQGKPTLVTNKDKRPAINSIESALDDFADVEDGFPWIDVT